MGMNLGVLLVAIDRFTQFITPVFHSKLWENNRLKICIFLHWFLSLACVFGFYFEKRPIIVSNNTDNGKTITYDVGNNAAFAVNMLVTISIVVIVLCCYGAIFVKAIFIAVQDQNETAQRMALNTVLIGFSTSACLFCFVLFECMLFFEVSMFGLNPNSLFNIILIVGELYTGSNPYCLLAFATKFRKNFKEMLFCKGGAAVSVAAENLNHHDKNIEMKIQKPKLVPRRPQPRVHII